MKIDFRQGIVSYPEVVGQGQAFLQVPGAGTVDVIGEVTVAFAQRTADYLHVDLGQEASGSYWTSLPTSGDVWLYWDINPQTAVVTYGYTTTQPTSGPTQPGTLVGTTNAETHWFDTTVNVMNVYDGTRFLERIRVFAARLNGTTLNPVGSNTQSPYAGTQVGINATTFAGQILFSNGLPVIVSNPGTFSPTTPFARNYTFATTETEFVTGGTQKVNSIRLESDFTTAQAFGNVAAYDVVKWTDFGVVAPAGYNDVESTTLGITVDAISNGQIGTIILQGIIKNEAWNWANVGQELYLLENGELTASDPNITTPSTYPQSKPPVARVVSEKEIVFMQGLGKVGPRGAAPESIDSIGDVELTNALQNQVLQFDGSPQLWRNQFALLGDLGNVELASVAASQALVFGGSPQLWRNSAVISASFGSPLNDGDFIQFNGTSGAWENVDRRSGNVGYFGVTPNTHDENYTFVDGDAGQGVFTVAASAGSPNATTYTWTLNPGIFKLGDVITLGRRFNAAVVNLATGNNVEIQSQVDGTSTAVGSPLPQFALSNPAQVTLWLVEAVGSPYFIGSPQTVVGSPGTDVWLINGGGLTTV